MTGGDFMRIHVTGDRVSDSVLELYVSELVKAHPEKQIESVDITVTGDFINVKMFPSLTKSA